jgi:hypothetical protein
MRLSELLAEVDGLPPDLEYLLLHHDLRNFEIDLRDGNAAVQSFSLDSSIICDRHDERLAIVCVLRNITERKRMDMELQKSRDQLEWRVKERTAALETANEKLRLVPSMLIQAQEKEGKDWLRICTIPSGRRLPLLSIELSTFPTGCARERAKNPSGF